MSKNELYNYLKSIGILNKNGGRKYCWKTLLTDTALNYFNEFSRNYRSADEAWFCLSNNVEPHICEVCGNLAKFTGSTKSKIKGYNTVCENCSANTVKTKIEHIKQVYNNKSDEFWIERLKKTKKSRLEKYGDENYSLYGSESFKKLMIDKYNNPYYNNHEKTEQTCLERYGVPHHNQTEEARKNISG